jgi:7-keto-8-aminopelargonate synthetase-like enzyme
MVFGHNQDRICDTIEAWQTSPTIFFEGIARRGTSIIPSAEILHLSDEHKRFYTVDDAFKKGIYSQGVRI